MRQSFVREFSKHFLKLFIPPISLLVAITVWLYLNEVETGLRLMKNSERLHVDQGKYHFESQLHNAIQDLIFIANSENIQRLVNNPDSNRYAEIVAHDFKTLVETKGRYDQIRYIALSGLEVVRVNYRNGKGIVVARPELQQKAQRYYLKEALSKGVGEVFISMIDLNVEHGVIESPPKPMLRIATPVDDESGSRRGIVIINCLAEKLIASLNQSDAIPFSRVLLLDSDGYWLKGESLEDEWGFMFSEKSGLRMNRRYPGAWRKITGSRFGQFRNDNGLFTYNTITANHLLTGMHPKPGMKPGLVDGEFMQWKLVRYIPSDDLERQAKVLGERYLIINGLLLSVWTIVAFSLSRARLFKIEASKQIHEKERRICEIVNSAFDAIITINERGIIETFNPAACRMFDYRESDVIGQKVNMLMASPEREYHDLHIQNFIESGEGRFVGRPGRVTGIKRDGTSVEMEICLGAKQLGDHWLFTAICRRYHERGESVSAVFQDRR